MATHPNERRVIVTTPHTIAGIVHEPDLERLQSLRLMASLKRQVVTETARLREIFNRECERQPAGAVTVGFAQIESTLYKRKRKSVPIIPTSLAHFGDLMEADTIMGRYGTVPSQNGQRHPFFRAILEGGGESRTAVFATPAMCAALESATELLADGTFKTVPRAAGIYQLFSIHAVVGEHTFPVVFALMTKRSKEAYGLLLTYVRTVLAPNMAPVTVLTDYERALMNAVREGFPEAAVVGCWFHYAQALWRRCQKLGMVALVEQDPHAAKAVRIAMVLPLLPAANMPQGLEELVAYADRHGLRDRLQDFTNYVRTTWLDGIGCETISVFRRERRTNNSVESFHGTLLTRIGQAHPSFWPFIERLATIASVEGKEIERNRRGIALRRATKKKYLANGQRIKECTARFLASSNPVAVRNFLSCASYAVGGVVGHFRRVGLHGGYDEAGEENDEPAPEPPAAEEPAIPAALLCTICVAERVTHINLPCGHIVLCTACVARTVALGNPRCAVCRAQIDEHRRAFFAH